MESVSVRELKAHWAEIEAKVGRGEEFVILNRGRPTAKIVPPDPGRVLKWDDHLATAIPASGKKAEEVVRADRDGRW